MVSFTTHYCREISTSSPPRQKHADVAESFMSGKMVLKHTVAVAGARECGLWMSVFFVQPFLKSSTRHKREEELHFFYLSTKGRKSFIRKRR